MLEHVEDMHETGNVENTIKIKDTHFTLKHGRWFGDFNHAMTDNKN